MAQTNLPAPLCEPMLMGGVSMKWAWNAFVAINATCHVGSGYSEIQDVNEVGGGGFSNFQDSFLFAEVLKYRYGLHDPLENRVKMMERNADMCYQLLDPLFR